MKQSPAEAMNALTEAHAALKAGEYVRLRALTMDERSTMVAAACKAAIAIQRSRIEAGLRPIVPDGSVARLNLGILERARRSCPKLTLPLMQLPSHACLPSGSNRLASPRLRGLGGAIALGYWGLPRCHD